MPCSHLKISRRFGGTLCFNVVYEVLTAMVMKSTIYWYIKPCSHLKISRRFGVTLCFNVVYEVLTAVVMKITIYWYIMPCSQLKMSRRFGETYHLNFQGRSQDKKLAWKQVTNRALHVSPKRQLTLNGMYGITFQKTVLFTVFQSLGSKSKPSKQPPICWQKDKWTTTNMVAERQVNNHQYVGRKTSEQPPICWQKDKWTTTNMLAARQVNGVIYL
jgi:ribosomal protein L34E